MLTKEQNIKTAFILSIIAGSSSDLILLGYILYSRISFFSFINGFTSLLLSPSLAAPLVLGIIALTLIRDAGDVKGKYRFFYIFSRIVSIASVVEGSILVTIGFITFSVRFISSIVFAVLI